MLDAKAAVPPLYVDTGENAMLVWSNSDVVGRRTDGSGAFGPPVVLAHLTPSQDNLTLRAIPAGTLAVWRESGDAVQIRASVVGYARDPGDELECQRRYRGRLDEKGTCRLVGGRGLDFISGSRGPRGLRCISRRSAGADAGDVERSCFSAGSDNGWNRLLRRVAGRKDDLHGGRDERRRGRQSAVV